MMVTGGAGFLGSHLCERLLGQGHSVIAVDNYSSGRRANIARFEGMRFTAIEQDVVLPLVHDGAVDAIYNLACPASPRSYQADPIHTTKTCVVGALNILDFAVSKGAKILQASTSEIYGDPDVHPQPEAYHGNVNPVGPRSCYDEGKRCAETLFSDYRRVFGLRTKICRIFNTYGPRMQVDDGRVVSNVIVQALQGRDITVYGSGNQTRSFCYVDDLIDGMISLMNAPDRVQGPINLGNSGEFTILELAELVLQLTGSRSRIVHSALPVDDPRQRKPDISQAADLLSWKPRIGLEEGLTRTIEYFDRFLRTASLETMEAAE
jgi:UDP-glucuronate decarboxylase